MRNAPPSMRIMFVVSVTLRAYDGPRVTEPQRKAAMAAATEAG
jgi:hypothetical protein